MLMFYNSKWDFSLLDDECVDTNPTRKCRNWKNKGKCSKNFAQTKCQLTCGVCTAAGNLDK